MVAITPTTAAVARMAPVIERTNQLRVLFEVEKAFLLTATTLIPRVGEPELKYRLAEHVWEAAQHAHFLRERAREMPGHAKDDDIRPAIWRVFDEAIRFEDRDGLTGLAAFYRVLKPALLDAYQSYLGLTDSLGDWPTTKLIEEFIQDESRHAVEMRRWLDGLEVGAHEAHVRQALDALGGWLGIYEPIPLPADFAWRSAAGPYRHPERCNRGKYPICGQNFSEDVNATAIVAHVFSDPQADPRAIRLMIYVWLFLEMDAVDYLSTVFYETPGITFDCHYDMARHLWDESRHSQFGWRALPRLGIDLMTVEQQINLYVALMKLRPHERYALMTQHFEAGSFEIKALIMDRVRELGDFEADTLLAFDRNDEQHHVRYGTRWLPTLMACFGEERPVKEWLADLQRRFAEIVGEVTPRIGHALPPEKRLTASAIQAFVKSQDAEAH